MLKDIEELRGKIKIVQEFKDPEAQVAKFQARYQQGEINLSAFANAIRKVGESSSEEIFAPPKGEILRIKNVATHYYLPVLLSEEEKID